MSSDEFRSNKLYVSHMRDLWQNDPIFVEAIKTLKEENVAVDADLNASELASVRILNRMIGYNNLLQVFLSLAQPITEPEPEPEPTFGVDLTQFQKPIPAP